MPRRTTARPADAASLRALQQRLPELSVPALLRVRDAIEALEARPRLRASDVAAVLDAAATR